MRAKSELAPELSGRANSNRVNPRTGVRELAWDYAPSARDKWEAQLIGHQHIPDQPLFHWH